MDDEAFKAAVMDRFDRIDGRFDRVDRRMDAIAARMDDVENRIENVAGLLALMQATVNQVVEASTRALDAIATLSSRVTRLENPDR